MNLDNSDFSKQNLKGVAFQQSIVRDSDFRGSNLVGASFFDATLDGSNFEDAGAYQCNVFDDVAVHESDLFGFCERPPLLSIGSLCKPSFFQNLQS